MLLGFATLSGANRVMVKLRVTALCLVLNTYLCSPIADSQGARVKEFPGKQAPLYRSGRVPSDEMVWAYGLPHG